MKLRTIALSLVSGVLVYVAVACASAVDRSSLGGESEPEADGRSPSVTDPVPEANAQTPAPPTYESVTEPCAHAVTIGPTEYRYAMHDYPGVTASELSHQVTALGAPFPGAFALPDYPHAMTLPWLRDGRAAAMCGPASSQQFETVTFVRRTP